MPEAEGAMNNVWGSVWRVFTGDGRYDLLASHLDDVPNFEVSPMSGESLAEYLNELEADRALLAEMMAAFKDCFYGDGVFACLNDLDALVDRYDAAHPATEASV